MFQSTHPHGVRLQCEDYGQGWRNVSIHAPTRGATMLTDVEFYNSPVSIHAPTRGATPIPINRNRTEISFNPRTHTGCDGIQHAMRPFGYGFNPRTHTGCDQPTLALLRDSVKFQSTHPHGVRLLPGASFCSTNRFQSTHPHGVRHSLRTAYTPGCVSIHAPTRGATLGHP